MDHHRDARVREQAPHRVKLRLTGREAADLEVDLEDGRAVVDGALDVAEHSGLGVERGRRQAAGRSWTALPKSPPYGIDRVVKAACIDSFGEPGRIRYGDLPDPGPVPGEVLVRAEAVAVNTVDTFVRSGAWRTPVT